MAGNRSATPMHPRTGVWECFVPESGMVRCTSTTSCSSTTITRPTRQTRTASRRRSARTPRSKVWELAGYEWNDGEWMQYRAGAMA